MKKFFYYSVLSLASVIFIFALLFDQVLLEPGNKRNSENKTSPEMELSELFAVPATPSGLAKALEANSDLPVAGVELYESEEPEGWAVFIPQTHKNPGTKDADPANDSAEQAQKEIYEIVKYLHHQQGVNLVMVEGEYYGPMDDNKFAPITEKLAVCSGVEEGLKNAGANLSATASDQAERALSILRREVYLSGAPFKLKAEDGGRGLIVYGAENPETHQACADIVRDYVYQRDRMQSIGHAGPGLALARPDRAQMIQDLRGSLGLGAAGNFGAADTMSEWREKLEEFRAMMSGEAGRYSLNKLIDLGALRDIMVQGGLAGQPAQARDLLENAGKELAAAAAIADDEAALAAAQALSDGSRRLDELEKTKESAAAAPSRQDNPYARVSDPGELRGMMAKTEEQIQSMVIDRRNLETAANFKKALEESGETLGMLQFGAGHEEGLIEELLKLNISVLVVKSDEIARREQSGT